MKPKKDEARTQSDVVRLIGLEGTCSMEGLPNTLMKEICGSLHTALNHIDQDQRLVTRLNQSAQTGSNKGLIRDAARRAVSICFGKLRRSSIVSPLSTPFTHLGPALVLMRVLGRILIRDLRRHVLSRPLSWTLPIFFSIQSRDGGTDFASAKQGHPTQRCVVLYTTHLGV